nr:MAG TPA: hypothetical protein [Caudoviricetes sp.]
MAIRTINVGKCWCKKLVYKIVAFSGICTAYE